MVGGMSACPVCGALAVQWTDVEGIPVFRCGARDCNFAFFDIAAWHPDDADYYADWTPSEPDSSAPWIRARVDLVRRFKDHGTAAELGCGIGETALALGRAGFSVAAVDDSAKAIRFLRGKFPGVEWQQESLVSFVADRPRCFDVVTMFHVLEHVPDPRQLMQLVDRALRPDGVVVIEVPDVGGGQARLRGHRWGYFHRAHVNYFSVRSLEKLMGQFGFRRRLLKRTYHFSYPQGDWLKDLIKGWLGDVGLNSIIRTAWTK